MAKDWPHPDNMEVTCSPEGFETVEHKGKKMAYTVYKKGYRDLHDKQARKGKD